MLRGFVVGGHSILGNLDFRLVKHRGVSNRRLSRKVSRTTLLLFGRRSEFVVLPVR
jgi:hypothetical protein